MPGVGRFVKLTARPGQGDALAQELLQVADSLRAVAGCELYVINRSASEPDAIWVNELWLSQEALDASLQALQTEEGKAQAEKVMSLLEGSPERIDVEPLGGVGYLAGGTGSTLINLLDDVEDQAPNFGLSSTGEARFAYRNLEAINTAISHQRLRPGARQAFGHRHHHAEEIYVVLAGSGRVKIDDEIREVRAHDAIRVAPRSMRAFEAGPDGLEVLAIGARHTGDVEMARDFWSS
jgi:quinol monooxygenase YgiN/mannose-6-phosphate isomerase-like protein (cupin superfamily)